jgi:hypothetical protein
MTRTAAFEFTPEEIKTIADSLPEPVHEQCRRLLPEILREWARTDLSRHLSMETRAKQRVRLKNMKKVRERACELLRALQRLDAADERGRAWLAQEMLRAEGRNLKDVGRFEEARALRQRLDEVIDFLARLIAIAPMGPSRGQPRNLPAYLVLQDAAAIFEWFTGTEATRQVDRSCGTETGRFLRFASALWPIIFGKGSRGLSAAMRNWAQGRSCYDERSPLIANIALRHPAWGVFQRQ